MHNFQFNFASAERFSDNKDYIDKNVEQYRYSKKWSRKVKNSRELARTNVYTRLFVTFTSTMRQTNKQISSSCDSLNY